MIHLRAAFLSVSATLTAACSSPAPPAVPPSDTSTFPALRDSGYAATTLIRDYPMPPARFRAWVEDGNKFVAGFEESGSIAKPVDTVYLTGDWPGPGATRRVELADGHYVLERVVANTPDRFEYQIWAMTNAAGRNVDHVHGVQQFDANATGGTTLTWTYKVLPNARWKRPFVGRFVRNEITPFLAGSLDNLEAWAAQEVAGEQVAGEG